MIERSTFVALIFSVLLQMPFVQPQQAQANSERIASQLARLRQRAAPQQDEGAKQPFIERLMQRLQGVEAALEAKRPHLALRRLGPIYTRAEAEIQVRANAARAKTEALDDELASLNEQFEKLHSQFNNEGEPSQTALSRALAQAFARSAVPYQQSGLQFARASDLPGGLYYLAVARDSLHFSDFCRQIKGGQPSPLIQAAGLQAEQQRLEAATLKAYQQPGAAIEQHSQFISLNSTLKELGELLAEGALEGALDHALEAQLKLSLIEAGSEAPEAQDSLARISSQIGSRLEGSLDHSIGLSYWEEAQELLEKPQSELEDLKRADALLKKALPLYFRLIHNP